jgi:hypothetical protein
MNISFYISAHGFGHAVRQSFLINKLPKYVSVFIVSKIPKSFWDEEISRDFFYRAEEFDCGAVQSSALTTDVEATFERYSEHISSNLEKLKFETDFCKHIKADAIISDMVPFASTIAKTSNIPSFAISNFSWFDIYSEFPDSPKKEAVLNSLKESLASFDYWIKLTPQSNLLHCKSKEQLSGKYLLKKGEIKSKKLRELLKVDENIKTALLYIGNYGLPNTNWKKLENFSGYHFFGFYPLSPKPSNYTQIKKGEWTMQDYSASADLIISKPGYGTVTESLSSGTPFLYLPRENFSEFRVLETALKNAGSVDRVEETEFKEFNWKSKIDRLILAGRREVVVDSDVDEIICWILERVIK